MSARVRNVAMALPTTCEWLPRHQCFIAWIDDNKIHEHHGFLWIKGKPGSGKSTIMKQTLVWAGQHWGTIRTIISYFFNARSPYQLEKSSLGLYRSLLWQLLHALSSIRALFVTRFVSKLRAGKVEEWRQVELQNFFIEITTEAQLQPLVVFIDALDEGHDDDVRSMV